MSVLSPDQLHTSQQEAVPATPRPAAETEGGSSPDIDHLEQTANSLADLLDEVDQQDTSRGTSHNALRDQRPKVGSGHYLGRRLGMTPEEVEAQARRAPQSGRQDTASPGRDQSPNYRGGQEPRPPHQPGRRGSAPGSPDGERQHGRDRHHQGPLPPRDTRRPTGPDQRYRTQQTESRQRLADAARPTRPEAGKRGPELTLSPEQQALTKQRIKLMIGGALRIPEGVTDPSVDIDPTKNTPIDFDKADATVTECSRVKTVGLSEYIGRLQNWVNVTATIGDAGAQAERKAMLEAFGLKLDAGKLTSEDASRFATRFLKVPPGPAEPDTKAFVEAALSHFTTDGKVDVIALTHSYTLVRNLASYVGGEPAVAYIEGLVLKTAMERAGETGTFKKADFVNPTWVNATDKTTRMRWIPMIDPLRPYREARPEAPTQQQAEKTPPSPGEEEQAKQPSSSQGPETATKSPKSTKIVNIFRNAARGERQGGQPPSSPVTFTLHGEIPVHIFAEMSDEDRQGLLVDTPIEDSGLNLVNVVRANVHGPGNGPARQAQVLTRMTEALWDVVQQHPALDDAARERFTTLMANLERGQTDTTDLAKLADLTGYVDRDRFFTALEEASRPPTHAESAEASPTTEELGQLYDQTIQGILAVEGVQGDVGLRQLLQDDTLFTPDHVRRRLQHVRQYVEDESNAVPAERREGILNVINPMLASLEPQEAATAETPDEESPRPSTERATEESKEPLPYVDGPAHKIDTWLADRLAGQVNEAVLQALHSYADAVSKSSESVNQEVGKRYLKIIQDRLDEMNGISQQPTVTTELEPEPSAPGEAAAEEAPGADLELGDNEEEPGSLEEPVVHTLKAAGSGDISDASGPVPAEVSEEEQAPEQSPTSEDEGLAAEGDATGAVPLRSEAGTQSPADEPSLESGQAAAQVLSTEPVGARRAPDSEHPVTRSGLPIPTTREQLSGSDSEPYWQALREVLEDLPEEEREARMQQFEKDAKKWGRWGDRDGKAAKDRLTTMFKEMREKSHPTADAGSPTDDEGDVDALPEEVEDENTPQQPADQRKSATTSSRSGPLRSLLTRFTGGAASETSGGAEQPPASETQSTQTPSVLPASPEAPAPTPPLSTLEATETPAEPELTLPQTLPASPQGAANAEIPQARRDIMFALEQKASQMSTTPPTSESGQAGPGTVEPGEAYSFDNPPGFNAAVPMEQINTWFQHALEDPNLTEQEKRELRDRAEALLDLRVDEEDQRLAREYLAAIDKRIQEEQPLTTQTPSEVQEESFPEELPDDYQEESSPRERKGRDRRLAQAAREEKAYHQTQTPELPTAQGARANDMGDYLSQRLAEIPAEGVTASLHNRLAALRDATAYYSAEPSSHYESVRLQQLRSLANELVNMRPERRGLFRRPVKEQVAMVQQANEIGREVLSRLQLSPVEQEEQRVERERAERVVAAHPSGEQPTAQDQQVVGTTDATAQVVSAQQPHPGIARRILNSLIGASREDSVQPPAQPDSPSRSIQQDATEASHAAVAAYDNAPQVEVRGDDTNLLEQAQEFPLPPVPDMQAPPTIESVHIENGEARTPIDDDDQSFVVNGIPLPKLPPRRAQEGTRVEPLDSAIPAKQLSIEQPATSNQQTTTRNSTPGVNGISGPQWAPLKPTVRPTTPTGQSPSQPAQS